ncbi:hypothetical protein GJ496_008525 [Pomphorhynchus laevis]|nr:hypothetical protein GJ496_008525 [Pomphorhynchus laevis]
MELKIKIQCGRRRYRVVVNENTTNGQLLRSMKRSPSRYQIVEFFMGIGRPLEYDQPFMSSRNPHGDMTYVVHKIYPFQIMVRRAEIRLPTDYHLSLIYNALRANRRRLALSSNRFFDGIMNRHDSGYISGY